jgi:HEAT repeat protein
MGLLDFLGGGTAADKATKLKAKVTQKYGDPATRQKAISQLGEMKTPEAVAVLMHRFTLTVDPHTTDADEKEHVFEIICGLEGDAVQPVKDFLKRSDAASSWALKVLEEILPNEEVIGIVCNELTRLGTEYTRDPEKKVVLMGYLEGKEDPRIAEAIVPLLADMSDDVKMAALKNLAPRKCEAAREKMLELLVAEETGKRVQTAALEAIATSEFTVQGFREKVEKRLGEGWQLDKSGSLKKRG